MESCHPPNFFGTKILFSLCFWILEVLSEVFHPFFPRKFSAFPRKQFLPPPSHPYPQINFAKEV